MKSLGTPNWVALPVSAGVGFSLGFDEEASFFVNSEGLKNFKELVRVLPDTPEEKIFDNTVQALEGTGFAFAIPAIAKGFTFAKQNLPKLVTKETVSDAAKLAAGGTIIGTSLAGEAKSEEKPIIDVSNPQLKKMGINPKLAVEFLKAGGKKVQELTKLKGGTGRAVFELDNEKVIKIAKKQRGLRENDLEGDFVVKNWLPKFHTSGRDYVVVENVGRADKELRQFLKPLQKFHQSDFDAKTPQLQEALQKNGVRRFYEL